MCRDVFNQSQLRRRRVSALLEMSLCVVLNAHSAQVNGIKHFQSLGKSHMVEIRLIPVEVSGVCSRDAHSHRPTKKAKKTN